MNAHEVFTRAEDEQRLREILEEVAEVNFQRVFALRHDDAELAAAESRELDAQLQALRTEESELRGRLGEPAGATRLG
jgi:hypothetical protein